MLGLQEWPHFIYCYFISVSITIYFYGY